MLFLKKKISPDSELVADILKNTRQEKKIELNDVVKELGINKKYLIALENGRYDLLPKGIYGKNFLREYAIFLGINHEKFLQVFDDSVKYERRDFRKKLFIRKIAKDYQFLVIPKLIKNILIIAFVFVCIMYLGFYIKNIVAPPKLVIIEPGSDISIEEFFINIYGKTDEEAIVTINQENVLTDADGYFRKNIGLITGVNNIEIIAKKKYSEENVIIRKILVK